MIMNCFCFLFLSSFLFSMFNVIPILLFFYCFILVPSAICHSFFFSPGLFSPRVDGHRVAHDRDLYSANGYVSNFD